MKRTVLLHRDISHLIAALGHTDEIVVADAGLPVPDGVAVIDLAVTQGVPSFWQVIAAIRSELVIEAALFASQADDGLRARFHTLCADWGAETGKEISVSAVPHDDFKARTAKARAIIRTGECTPYCNMILTSSVPF